MFLIEKTVELKKYAELASGSSGMMESGIERVLKSKIFFYWNIDIYKLMNMAVDCNQLRFLILLILLTGDICYRVKDHNRAFYFYN